MRILITKASDDDFQEIRENQSAQDMLNLMNEFNKRIIIRKGGFVFTNEVKNENRIIDKNFDYTVTIYDSYIE